MSEKFDRDAMAVLYARRHKKIDPGVREIHYLPTGAPASEIRFVEVNDCIPWTASPEAIDFGVDAGSPNEHRLVVFDVTPEQWEEICQANLPLPEGWTLEGSQKISEGRQRKRQ